MHKKAQRDSEVSFFRDFLVSLPDCAVWLYIGVQTVWLSVKKKCAER